MTTTSIEIPGYVVGTWTVDGPRSEIGFSVRHMMVSKVRGRFREVSGEVITAANPLESTVTATINLDSVDTGNVERDAHLRSADFFEVAKFGTMTYRSTGVRVERRDLVLDGDLTLKGITKPVPLRLEVHGFGTDSQGRARAGFSARGEIKRTDFGVNFHAVMEAGGVVVGDVITINLEIELMKTEETA